MTGRVSPGFQNTHIKCFFGEMKYHFVIYDPSRVYSPRITMFPLKKHILKNKGLKIIELKKNYGPTG